MVIEPKVDELVIANVINGEKDIVGGKINVVMSVFVKGKMNVVTLQIVKLLMVKENVREEEYVSLERFVVT